MSIACPHSSEWPSGREVFPATPTSWVPCSPTVYNETTKPTRPIPSSGRDPNATRCSRAYFQESLGLFCDTSFGNQEWEVVGQVTNELLRVQAHAKVSPIRGVKYLFDTLVDSMRVCTAEEALMTVGLSPAEFDILARALAGLKVHLLNSCDTPEEKDLFDRLALSEQTREAAYAAYRIVLRTVVFRPVGQHLYIMHVHSQIYLLSKMVTTAAAMAKRREARQHAGPPNMSNITQLSRAMQRVTVGPAGGVIQRPLHEPPKRVVGLTQNGPTTTPFPVVDQPSNTQCTPEATIDIVTTLPDHNVVECLDGIPRSISFAAVITLIEEAWETRIAHRLEVAIIAKLSSSYHANGMALLPGYGYMVKRVVRSESQWRAFVEDSIGSSETDWAARAAGGFKVGVWCKRGAL